MELGTLEREIQIDASPEIVFEVVSQPEHLREWWPDEVTLDVAPGGTGELIWGDREHVERVVVVEVDPPRLFSFLWVAPTDETPDHGNSLLVSFALEPHAGGTRLRMTESGFREKGWEAAVLEDTFADHERGWDMFLPRLREYAPSVALR